MTLDDQFLPQPEAEPTEAPGDIPAGNDGVEPEAAIVDAGIPARRIYIKGHLVYEAPGHWCEACREFTVKEWAGQLPAICPVCKGPTVYMTARPTKGKPASEASTAAAPPAQQAEFPDYEPPVAQVRARCAASGRDPLTMRRLLQEEGRAFTLQMLQLDPRWVKQQASDIIEARGLLEATWDGLAKKREDYNALCDLLMQVACGREQLASDRAKLEGARATLEDPACLNLPDGELVRLNAEAKHLPAGIAAMEKEVQDLAARVPEFAKSAGFDPRAVAEVMSGEAGAGTHVRRLFEQGLFNV